MNFIDKLNQDIKEAMKAKAQEKLTALRALKSEILLFQTSGQGDLTDDKVLDILQKMVKQRKQSAEIYKEQGRDDLYEKEMKEVEFIAEYLPKQLSEEEIETKVKEIITKIGANSIKDMGKVMGIASKDMKGKADNKIISKIVKKLLT